MPITVLAALLVPQLIAGVLASRERQVLAPRDDRVSQRKCGPRADENRRGELDPWDDERDWFTPARSPPPQDPKDGPPSVEGEPGRLTRVRRPTSAARHRRPVGSDGGRSGRHAGARHAAGRRHAASASRRPVGSARRFMLLSGFGGHRVSSWRDTGADR